MFGRVIKIIYNRSKKNTLGQNVSLKHSQKMHETMSARRNLYMKIHFDDRITTLENATMNRERQHGWA